MISDRFLTIERLESRIAPAVTIVNPHTATYVDVDGDHVTIHVSTGTLTSADFTTTPSGLGDQLEAIDLSSGGFDGANLTVTVTKAPHGDGLANIGYINSTGHDLGNVSIPGDLGRIDAGNSASTTPAVISLSVRSMGRLGTDTQAPGGNLISVIQGSLGNLDVAQDINSAFITIGGGVKNNVGSVTIGGSLIGGSVSDTGEIIAAGSIGPVKIGHDLQGGTASRAGVVESAAGAIGSITVGGSIIGGAGLNSGYIFGNQSLGPVKIAHDLIGGAGNGSASISTTLGNLASLSIGGSIIGGAGIEAGNVLIEGSIGSVTIGHDLAGGSGDEAGSIYALGGPISRVAIGGSLIGGSDTESGFVLCETNMGPLMIRHDLTGGSGDEAGQIVSRGNIASGTVGGSIVGGIADSSGGIVADGTMGHLTIGHDLVGGSGVESGTVTADSKFTGITVGGSLVGGSGVFSGVIYGGSIGTVLITHDFVGGSISGSASLDSSGLIESGGAIASITIGGSITAGENTSSGALTNSAAIYAANNIDSLTVRGGILGNSTERVIISSRGQPTPLPSNTKTDIAIDSINVAGRVEFTNILAGYQLASGPSPETLTPIDPNAQIGSVTVGADWIASSIAAGATNSGYPNFGDTNDAGISGASPSIHSRIASITIAGEVSGTPNSVSSTDHFGFVAEEIGMVEIHGVSIVIPSTNTPEAIGETTDVTVHIIA